MNETLRFQGIAASKGIAIGKVHVVERRPVQVEALPIPEEHIEAEIERFRRAIAMSSEEIQAMRQRVAQELDEAQASIFDAHLLILSDPAIVNRTISRIRSERLSAEYVFQKTVDELSERLAQIQDEFFSQRNSDFADVARRVVNNLLALDSAPFKELDEDAIVVARDLGPSDTAHMTRGNVLGFCIDQGGRTSHTAIMAKALQIPAVVGLGTLSREVQSGDTMIVDGLTGVVILRPSEADIEAYRRRAEEWSTEKQSLGNLRDLPALTSDNVRISLFANIELPTEIDHVREHGAEGIGLFRSEFIFLDRDHLPGEEEQYQAYRSVIEEMGGQKVIIRTLDIGGDKFLSALPIDELNPFMGLRALRLCFENPEMFKTQLRAILRAAAGQTLHILFPMVSGVEDFMRARRILFEVRRGLADEGAEIASEIKAGAMIEIPSAAITSDLLAAEADFFSIGTNDLIQYTLAVDRGNKRISYLYDPLHPSVLRLIEMTVRNARERGIPVAVCGEMAADPETAAVLVGLGIRELSMGPVDIAPVKRFLRSVRVADLEQLARELLALGNAQAAREHLSRVAEPWMRGAGLGAVAAPPSAIRAVMETEAAAEEREKHGSESGPSSLAPQI